MNDVDKLSMLLHETMMHMEAELSDRVETLKGLSARIPTAENVLFYRDAIMEEEVFKNLRKRVCGVLDFFGG